ncbi:MAG TPA: succinylglutamate desuccinylase/aspartoacylase family protein [Planctomycetota bacterium]|nr:succinylglutamate desuccinylase/aspartoacylase family protein [Planctomycetota bacterium]
MSARKPFRVGAIETAPGTRKDIRIKVSEQTHAGPLHIPVTVVHGARPGPTLFVTSTIHGDELNGIEVIRRLRHAIDPARLGGTLLLVAIANPVSFVLQQRGLPDGRDLNRCFPGRRRGTIGSEIAHDLFQRIIRRCDAGVDLHTAGHGRSNLPHIRADIKSPRVRRLAREFGASIMIDMPGERGSLRREAARARIPVITVEAGEALRFDLRAIEMALTGILNVLGARNMYPIRRRGTRRGLVFRRHVWLRARRGGILVMTIAPGDVVRKHQLLGFTSRPLGTRQIDIAAPFDSLVVSATTIPTVLPGSAICHLLPLNGEKPSIVRKYLKGYRGRG